MNNNKVGAEFVVLLTCGVAVQSFAQDSGTKFNSKATGVYHIYGITTA